MPCDRDCRDNSDLSNKFRSSFNLKIFRNSRILTFKGPDLGSLQVYLIKIDMIIEKEILGRVSMVGSMIAMLLEFDAVIYLALNKVLARNHITIGVIA